MFRRSKLRKPITCSASKPRAGSPEPKPADRTRSGMSLESDAMTVAAYAGRVLPLATAALDAEYHYQSLPLCVIDAVFSIGVKYSGTRRVVARYCEFTGQRRIR